ncbi:MAG TPA: hypothetical protein DCO86_04565, partial [Spirochaetaceae bacterium]|nr:hypothetical protein [Spirochaetaceae bacterium]
MTFWILQGLMMFRRAISIRAAALSLVCISLFASCASESEGRSGMPSWWNEPESPESICNQFVSVKCDYDDLSQIPSSERQRLVSSAVSQARDRIFGFFKASSLPSDLFNVGREGIARLEGENAYIARVEIPYQHIYDYNPNVMRLAEEGRRSASKKFEEAVALYEEYQDAKAVGAMFEAACISFDSRVVTGDFSYKRLIGIAAGMLRKIEIIPGELSSNMERSVLVRRSSNIIKEGISGAMIRMRVSAEDNTPVYAVDYVTNEKGMAFFDKTSYMLPKRCRLDYALELGLTSRQRRLGNLDPDFQSFFDVL